MLFNSYSYEILYEQFHWIYLQGDIKLLLVTVKGLNLKLKSFTTYRVTLYIANKPTVWSFVLQAEKHITYTCQSVSQS